MTFLWIHSLVSTIIFVLTLLFVSSILRARRAAGSTLAWLFLICAFPYIGIPVYLLLSSRKIRRSVITLHSTQSLVQKKSPRDLSPTQRVLQSSGIPGAKENDMVELLPTGVEAYDAVMRMIEEANKTIYITTFIFGNDPVGIAFVDALARKAEAGIDVRIIIDSLGATLIHHPSFRRLV